MTTNRDTHSNDRTKTRKQYPASCRHHLLLAPAHTNAHTRVDTEAGITDVPTIGGGPKSDSSPHLRNPTAITQSKQQNKTQDQSIR